MAERAKGNRLPMADAVGELVVQIAYIKVLSVRP